jgi:hypothetical protein
VCHCHHSAYNVIAKSRGQLHAVFIITEYAAGGDLLKLLLRKDQELGWKVGQTAVMPAVSHETTVHAVAASCWQGTLMSLHALPNTLAVTASHCRRQCRIRETKEEI